MSLRYILRCNGTREELDGPKSMRQLEQLIGAQTFDCVNLRNADGQVMLVDDNGYETTLVELGVGRLLMKPVRALKPVNAEATKLYHSVCAPGTTHQIVGDVAVVPDEDFA